jgi:hypothetical protein
MSQYQTTRNRLGVIPSYQAIANRDLRRVEMLDPQKGADIIQAIVDEFMLVRDQFAPKHTIQREALDGFMSATVIDRGTRFFISTLELEANHAPGAQIVVTHLFKLLYDLESRRFENGGHTDGHDLVNAAKDRLFSHYTSEMMKNMSQQHELLSFLGISEAREAVRRLARVWFENHGEAHGVTSYR